MDHEYLSLPRAESKWTQNRCVSFVIAGSVILGTYLGVQSLSGTDERADFLPRASDALLDLANPELTCYKWPASSWCDMNQKCTGYGGGAQCQIKSNKCYCEGCAGGDRRCYEQPGILVAQNVTIANMQWPHYYAYVYNGVMGYFLHQVRVSVSKDNSSYFNLYMLPDHEFYLLAPTVFQASAVGDLSRGGAYVLGLDVVGFSHSVLKLCNASNLGYPQAVELIGSSGKKMYLKALSWLVYASKGHLGKEGLWTFNPSVHLSLPVCAE